jgi:hypothetical protein
MGVLTVLFLIMFTLKLLGVIASSWLVVCSPLLLELAIVVFVVLVAVLR